MAEIPPPMQALGRVVSGLYIVTAENGGQRVAFLASWVVQAGFNPPAVSVAIKQDRPIMRQIGRGARLCLSILGKEDKALMGQFAKAFAPDADPFAGADIGRTEKGTPYLKDALGYLELEVMRVLEPSTEHNLVSAEVVGGAMLKEGEPWSHVRRNGANY
ncbi:MAG: flavin reductase family protein [Planctomycetes bacterium]|nr:flavin reductase family protein [Planctomycetota bacterium]